MEQAYKNQMLLRLKPKPVSFTLENEHLEESHLKIPVPT